MTEDGAIQPRVTAAWWMTLLAALVMLGSTTASIAAESSRNPLEPVDTSSPHATFLAFRNNMEKAYRSRPLREGTETDAQAQTGAPYADLRHVGEALLMEIGVADALYLYETLNWI